MKTTKSYNVQIWVGTKNTNTGIVHQMHEIEEICQKYVDKVGLCVTVTQTKFIYSKGNENGAIIGLISYPRFPSTRKLIRKKALKLAEILMITLEQYRVTVTTPFKSYMLENKRVSND